MGANYSETHSCYDPEIISGKIKPLENATLACLELLALRELIKDPLNIGGNKKARKINFARAFKLEIN